MSMLMTRVVMLASALMLLGAVVGGEAKAQALRVIHTSGSPAQVNTGWTCFSLVRNGHAIVTELCPTTPFGTTLPTVPNSNELDGGLPETTVNQGFNFVVFNNGGVKTYTQTNGNHPLWPDFGEANALPEFRVTVTGATASGTAGSMPAVTQVYVRIYTVLNGVPGHWVFNRNEVRPHSLNWQAMGQSGKVNFVMRVTKETSPGSGTLVQPNCTGPGDTTMLRAPIGGAGIGTITIGLLDSVISGTVTDGVLTIEADAAGPFSCANDLGHFEALVEGDDIFGSGFE